MHKSDVGLRYAQAPRFAAEGIVLYDSLTRQAGIWGALKSVTRTDFFGRIAETLRPSGGKRAGRKCVGRPDQGKIRLVCVSRLSGNVPAGSIMNMTTPFAIIDRRNAEHGVPAWRQLRLERSTGHSISGSNGARPLRENIFPDGIAPSLAGEKIHNGKQDANRCLPPGGDASSCNSR